MAKEITADQSIKIINQHDTNKTAVVSRPLAESSDGGSWSTHHWSEGCLHMDRNNYFFTALSEDGSHKKSQAGRTFVLMFDDPVEFADPSNGTPLQDLIASIEDGPNQLSYVLQTSHNKYQAGIILKNHGLSPRAIDKVMEALLAKLPEGAVDAGPGVRMARLPGINNKAKHVEANGGQPFESRYTEWRPEAKFPIGALLELTGLTTEFLEELDNIEPGSMLLDEDHPVFDSDLIKVTRKNDIGWLFPCPWRAEHTAKDADALLTINSEGYVGFKCFHAHCSDKDGWSLLELLNDKNKGMIAKVNAYKEELAIQAVREKIIALSSRYVESERNALIKEYTEQTVVLAEFVFISGMNRYLHLPSGLALSREAFNHSYGRIDETPANLLKSFDCCNAMAVTTHFDRERFFTEDQVNYFNLFTSAGLTQGIEGDIQPYLDHVEHLYGDRKDFLLKIQGFTMQHAGEKINWLTVLGGNKGVGKDALLAPIRKYFGRYHTTVEARMLMSDFNSYIEGKKFLVLNELSAPGQKEGADLHNRVKGILASPPETITINKKGIPSYEIHNQVTVFATTNNPNALPIERDARRFFMVWSEVAATKENLLRAQELYKWYARDNNILKVIHYLMTMDLGDFSPVESPPVTDWQIDTAEASKSYLQHAIDELAEAKTDGEYDLSPLVSAAELRELLLLWRIRTKNEDVRIPPVNKLGAELKRLQYKSVEHDGKRPDVPRKLWLIRDFEGFDDLSRKEKLDLYEAPPTGENII